MIIESSAFRNNDLYYLTLPSTLTEIGHAAFSGNIIPLGRRLTIPDNIERIGDYAFYLNAWSSGEPSGIHEGLSVGKDAFQSR
ncbi:leucine-rich repeat protein [Tindallia magadiensis]|uniref:leucine-rich repeat protein n=1 Tax=Tindallia magadiensis TaxID=69895 RepID=UPI000B129AB3